MNSTVTLYKTIVIVMVITWTVVGMQICFELLTWRGIVVSERSLVVVVVAAVVAAVVVSVVAAMVVGVAQAWKVIAQVSDESKKVGHVSEQLFK